MAKESIHPSAIVGDEVSLGEGVQIGPFAVIEKDVHLGDFVEIAAHAIIHKGSIIGAECRIDSNAVIGGDPQFSGFNREMTSGVKIGKNTIIREGVTIHRSCYENQYTQVGENCMLMGNSHVAHDCIVSDSVILANGVLLAGHVSVGNRTFIGGNAAIHQFVRIGEGAMVGGLAAISKDVPPFCMVTDRNIVHGLNLVGLKRSGIERETMKMLKEVFREVFSATHTRKLALEQKQSLDSIDEKNEVYRFLSFFEDGERGFSIFRAKSAN